jgi:hypothetical protein
MALGLDPATWARLSPLLDEALALPPERRAAWLAALPADAADLRERLAAMLDPAARSLADAPSLGDDDEEPTRRAGQAIGPSHLIEPLGRGGTSDSTASSSAVRVERDGR